MLLKFMLFVLVSTVSSFNLIGAEVGCSSQELAVFEGKINGGADFMLTRMLYAGDLHNAGGGDLSKSFSIVCNGKIYYPDRTQILDKTISFKYNNYSQDGTLKKSLKITNKKPTYEESLGIANAFDKGGHIELAENGLGIDDSIIVYKNQSLSGKGITLKEALKEALKRKETGVDLSCMYSNQPEQLAIKSPCEVKICQAKSVNCYGVDATYTMTTTDISCLAKSDGSCPGATECFEDQYVTNIETSAPAQELLTPASAAAITK